MSARTRISLTLSLFMIAFAACSSPGIRVPVVKEMPERFIQVMRGGTKIAILYQKKQEWDRDQDWVSRVEGSARNAIQDAGYFTLVDIENRSQRLDELAYTQSGMTRQMKEIGQELTIDGILFLNVPRRPKVECHEEMSYVTKQSCIQTDTKGNCTSYKNYQEAVHTGVLHVNVGMDGNLVNLETGESLQYSHNETYKYSSNQGNRSCPATLSSTDSAIKSAATTLAKKLSPTVEPINVEVRDSSETIELTNNDAVSEKLETGVGWINEDPPVYDRARELWEEAWNLSGRKCPEAAWNLGAYYWMTGDMDQAQRYFKDSLRLGGKVWEEDDDIRSTYGVFLQEKQRKEMMR